MNRQTAVPISVGALEGFLRRAQRELRLGAAEVTVCLVSDAEIAAMNESYRKKAGPTDVLSFPAGKRRGAASLAVQADAKREPGHARLRLRVSLEMASGEALGDIAIAPAVAQQNAKRCGRTLPAEIKILILHGILHLLGYDHEADHGEMERTEKRLRRRLGLS